ncbi:MAG: hypothetical protein LUF80_02415 [Oscillospiraceae bacterium]|nr:hypothetical protein [Oscillospiraceae bacterium]
MNEQNWGITPCKTSVDVTTKEFVKLGLDTEQKIQVEALLNHLPSALAANSMSNLYMVQFPEGLPHTLMKLKRGGYTTSIVDTNGRIQATASLHAITPQAVALGCFSVMSIASSQYFLKRINNELKMMRFNLDKILEFLYGDKKAELMAEVSFVKYAYENFSSIMSHEEQRSAMISSLHNSKKVAIKDIEFYMGDLDSVINSKDGKEISTMAERAFQIKESLEFAIQLYGMSSLLEIYYAENYDQSYLRYISNDMSVYIDKCEKRMLNNFSALKVLVDSAKGSPFKKIDKLAVDKQIDAFIESLTSGEDSEMQKSLKEAINAMTKKAEYYMTSDGDVYLKQA